MNRRATQTALLLVALALAVCGLSVARAAGGGRQAETRLAGPWYTPHELEALIAYSNARAIRSTGPAAARVRGYTPAELKELIAYSNASFAEKKAILAGGDVGSLPGDTFHWGDASVGAGAAFAALLLVGGTAALVVRARKERRRLRPT